VGDELCLVDIKEAVHAAAPRIPAACGRPSDGYRVGLTSQLAQYLIPTRRDIADTLGAPVDDASY
jgi:hypothetical protein